MHRFPSLVRSLAHRPHRQSRPVRPARATPLLAFVLVLVAAAAGAAEPSREQRFESANADFAAGRFAEARQGFAELVARDGPSVAVLYNLGNAAFRAGRIGEAILSYERALLLSPRDQDVRANLRQVRKAAGLPDADDGPWRPLVRFLTASGWAWLASAGLYLACAALLARRLAPGGASARQARSALTAAASAGLAIVVLASAACATRMGDYDRAVVLDGDPALRVAPYASATASSELAPGEIVRIERTYDGFTLVRTGGGRSGWMAAAAVARVSPAAG